nr:reverse transcriptase domain-containing protein [Tanacetum cinerariifolium]
MACSLPHIYDEIKSMVRKQIQEDRGHQLVIMNLAHQFDNAITAKDELQKAYEECRDIPLAQHALIENFLKIESELDQQCRMLCLGRQQNWKNKSRIKISGYSNCCNGLVIELSIMSCNLGKCLAASGNTFLEYRDNIQGYVSAATGNYNQGNPGYRPQGSRTLPGNTIANPKGELKAITTRSGLVTDGPTIPNPPKSVIPEEDECVEETYTDPAIGEGPTLLASAS